MVQVRIAHSQQDRAVAQRLAAFLEGQGRTVSWGTGPSGDQDTTGRSEADMVIVIWSKSSVGAAFVVQEAVAARDARKLLHVVNSEAQPKSIPIRRPDEPMFDVDDVLQISLAVHEASWARDGIAPHLRIS